MTYKKNIVPRLLLLSVLTIALGFVLNSCTPKEEDNLTASPLPEAGSHLFTKNVVERHEKGGDPCPQEVARVKVFCGIYKDSCDADSVVVTNPHPGLTSSFPNGNLHSPLLVDPNAGLTFRVLFNCNVPQSIVHKYKFVFYKNGVVTKEEELRIEVKVV